MFDHSEYQQAMENVIERFKSEMQKVRTGRTSRHACRRQS